MAQIKDENFFFGGFTAAEWSCSKKIGSYIADTKAFLFSMRRDGVSCNHKFMVKNKNAAIGGHPNCGPVFGKGQTLGSGHEIFIKDESNKNIGNSTNLGTSYHYSFEHGDSKTFLAGTYDGWLTTEIEVYQINK